MTQILFTCKFTLLLTILCIMYEEINLKGVWKIFKFYTICTMDYIFKNQRTISVLPGTGVGWFTVKHMLNYGVRSNSGLGPSYNTLDGIYRKIFLKRITQNHQRSLSDFNRTYVYCRSKVRTNFRHLWPGFSAILYICCAIAL